jgi:hypothetical protein
MTRSGNSERVLTSRREGEPADSYAKIVRVIEHDHRLGRGGGQEREAKLADANRSVMFDRRPGLYACDKRVLPVPVWSLARFVQRHRFERLWETRAVRRSGNVLVGGRLDDGSEPKTPERVEHVERPKQENKGLTKMETIGNCHVRTPEPSKGDAGDADALVAIRPEGPGNGDKAELVGACEVNGWEPEAQSWTQAHSDKCHCLHEGES